MKIKIAKTLKIVKNKLIAHFWQEKKSGLLTCILEITKITDAFIRLLIGRFD